MSANRALAEYRSRRSDLGRGDSAERRDVGAQVGKIAEKVRAPKRNECDVRATRGVWRHPKAGLFAPPTPFTTEAIGIALPADDFLFVNLVQNYLTMLQQSGLLTQLQAKWLTEGSWLNDLR